MGGLAIAVGLWVAVWERKFDSTNQVAQKARFLTLWEEGTVETVRIAGPGGELEVEKEAGKKRWRLIRPVEDEADPEKMAALVRLLCRLPLVERLQGAEFSAEEFGFSRSNVIEVDLLSSRGVLGKLLLGREGPFEKTAYASMLQPDGSTRSGLVRMELRDWMASPLAQLRDRRLLRVPPGAITQYRMKTVQGEILLRRDEREPRWHIDTPLQCRANDDIAYSLLEELTTMQAEEFRDDQALTGLAAVDEQTAVFRLEKGAETPLEISLRQEQGPDGVTYLLAKRSGRKAVLRIRDDLVRRLPRNVNQLRYPYLAEVPVNVVARITIRSRTDPDVVLFHSGTEWKQSYRSEQWPANTGRIEELLAALNTEPVLEFRASAGAQAASYGLDSPILSLSLTTSQIDPNELKQYRERKARSAGEGKGEPAPKAQVETRTLRFGRGEDAFLNANYEGEPYIYAIDPSFVQSHAPTHPLKWRGLRLTEFRPIDLREIAISEPGGADLLLNYDATCNQWTGLLNGQRIDEKINPRLAEGLAYHLGSLTAVDWLTERREALRALQRPGCRVRVKISRSPAGAQNERTEQFALLLAPSVQDDRVLFYFGQFEGQPDVFLLKAESFARLIYPVLKRDL